MGICCTVLFHSVLSIAIKFSTNTVIVSSGINANKIVLICTTLAMILVEAAVYTGLV